MEVKKNPKADLNNKKGIFLEIGLIVTLVLCIVGFNLGQKDKEIDLMIGAKEIIEQEDVAITEPPKEEPIIPEKQAPNIIADILNVVKNDSKIETEFNWAEFEEEFEVIPLDIEEDITEDEFFIIVEEMPKFQGGDLNTFRAWVMKEFRFPAIALENGIQGTVTVEFVIERDGRLTNIKFLRSPDPVFNDETRRILNKSPKWTPGRQRNTAVRVKYVLPIQCKIE